MPSLKMVFNEKSEEQRGEEKIVKKIFTCSEIEEVSNHESAMKTVTTPTNNLPHDDPAVLYSSSIKLTRYDKAQLRNMQDSPLSQQKPPCFYDARIIHLNILKLDEAGNSYDHILEEHVKMLQRNMQTLNLQNWNSGLYQNIRNYQQALLNPNRPFRYAYTPPQPPPSPSPSVMQPQQQRRRVTFNVDEQQKQQNTLDRILPYDRKTVFFDTLTTTTMQEPKRQITNNNMNSLTTNRRQTFNSNAFGKNSHANNYFVSEQQQHRYASSMYAHPGYFSNNNGMRSSQYNDAKASDFYDMAQSPQVQSDINEDNNNPNAEPEWFSVPITRGDIVDIHEINVTNESAIEAEIEMEMQAQAALKEMETQAQKRKIVGKQQNRKVEMGPIKKPTIPQQMPPQQHAHSVSFDGGNFRNNNQYDNSHLFESEVRPHNSQYFNRSANNNQRFRNPLHHTHNQSFSPKTPTLPPAATNAFASSNYNGYQPMNPYYEAWKSDKMVVAGQKVYFANLMQHAQANHVMPPTIRSMSEIEDGIMQNNLKPKNAFQQPISRDNIQNFFQNFSGSGNINNSNNRNPFHPNPNGFDMLQQQQQRFVEPFSFPTVEQLQQHTSEILRNAILRNREQQYHDENNQHNNN